MLYTKVGNTLIITSLIKLVQMGNCGHILSGCGIVMSVCTALAQQRVGKALNARKLITNHNKHCCGGESDCANCVVRAVVCCYSMAGI